MLIRDMLIILFSHLFHRAWNLPSFILSPYSTISTLLILAVCRTRVKYEPTIYIYSLALHPWVRILRSSSGLRAPAKWLGGHRFVSCRELRFFFFSLSHVRDVFIISFSHLFHRVKIYHHSFLRYLYYSNPFLAYCTLHFMFWHALYIPLTNTKS